MKQTMTAPKIKALLKKAGTSRGCGPSIYVAEVGGKTYCSDSYWLAPVDRVQPLLDHFNLSAEVGTYGVNGSVSKTSDTAPNLAQLLADHMAEAKVGAMPVKVAGHIALVDLPVHGMAAVFESPDGTHYGVRAEFLAFLAGDDWAEKLAHGTLILTQRAESNGLKPVGVYVLEEHSSTMANTYKRHTWHTPEPVAIVMPIRISV